MAKSQRPKEGETPPEIQTPPQETPVTTPAVAMVGVKVVNGTFIDFHYKDADNLDQNIKLSQASPILEVPATQENLDTLDAYVSRGIVNLIKKP